MSTSYCLTKLVNEMTASLDSKMNTTCVFVDLDKFLIQLIISCFVKIEFYSIRGVAHN